MKLNVIIAVLMVTSLSCVAAEPVPHWDYEGEAKPENWGKLSPEFSTCENGKNQSPINIEHALKTHHDKLKLVFKPGKQEIINNGHTVQVNVDEGNTLEIDNEVFTLQQFHFHTPSENEINGKHFPMAAHFVYKSKNGDLAVVGLMFKKGKPNLELAKAWQQIPTEAGSTAVLNQSVDIKALLPNRLNFYRFSGSLTTPPCTEGVIWIVLEQESNVSTEQIEKFHSIMHHNNNRPIQPLHGRVIID
ncbi:MULTISPECIES: carbonic anhydrase [unclassified Gilliamella]|uniref:carbonic anhydrase n=1 Tax=unclassified Gilliamella TaxID=2685620 RepID=UPI00080E7570|nr:carbonic anhydrase family protein [Gilliamella apicola]OCG22242.1 carbonic anhydrase [Gilliamella apicola]OCG25568.1 carbonic anhydrase [Gilliamella apicola]